MKAVVADVISAMERIAPLSLAEAWDNSGLQIGRLDRTVSKVVVALDPTKAVVEFACAQSADMLITHHPLIFKPLKSINTQTPVGKLIRMALDHDLAVYSAHTNLDAVHDGVNDILARAIGLKQIAVPNAVGNDKGAEFVFCRKGILEPEMTLLQAAGMIKSVLKLDHIKVAGNPEMRVRQVLTCCGSGSAMMGLFLGSGAQVFISGDLKYHDARDAESIGAGLIDIGHFASEHLMLTGLAEILDKELANADFDVKVSPCKIEKDPFLYY